MNNEPDFMELDEPGLATTAANQVDEMVMCDRSDAIDELHALNKLLREHTTHNYNISACLNKVEKLIDMLGSE